MQSLTPHQSRNIFWALLGILFIYCLAVVPHYGITGDEVTQWKYGDLVWKYIKTFGGDKTILTDKYVNDNPLKYYGGFFDGIAAMLIDIIKPKDEFLVRHYWNLVFGFAGVVFGGLIVKEFSGWIGAIIAVIFLVLTPRYFGEIFNNPKDIPFATGYLAALLCSIKWLKALDNPSWKQTIWLGLAIALAISVRVGGILVIAYLGMFYLLRAYQLKLWTTPAFRKSILQGVVAVIIGWVGACLFWPYALEDIINNPIESVKVMSAYPLNITTLYEGVKVRTSEIPSSYMLKWLQISTPLFVIIGAIGSIGLLYLWRKQERHFYLMLLFFAAAFPVIYIIYKKSVVYDGIRHVLFVLPVITILAALFFDYLINNLLTQKALQYATIGVLTLLLILPARFMLANHPNEYIYFNELSGGAKAAYGNYETDYYFNSIKQGMDWLLAHDLKNAKPSPGNDSIIVASNVPEMMAQYQKISPIPFKFIYVRYYQRGEKDWDYGVFSSRFADKEQLQNGFFPGDKPLHVIEVDDIPITTILKNDLERNAYKAKAAEQQGNDTLAIAYYNKAVQQYPTDVESYVGLAMAYFKLGNKNGAFEAIDKAYKISSLDMNTANVAGAIYLQGQAFDKAKQVYGKMTVDYPTAAEGFLGLAQAQASSRDFNPAIENFNTAISLDGRVQGQAYMGLAYIYQQKGDLQTAQKYAQAAQQAQGR
jgi:Flp pilus assembly protein TadD